MFEKIMTDIGYILAAILCLMFMVMVHESGHYLAGKLLGFKINEYSIGFGPAIFKRKSKKTGQIFAIRWIPLGGYCAFYGEEDETEEDKKRREDKKKKKDKKKNKVIEVKEEDVFDEGVKDTSLDDNSVSMDAIVEEKDVSVNSTAVEGEISDTSDTKAIPFNDQKPWKRIIVFLAGAFFNYLSAIMILAIFFMAYGDYLPKVVDVYPLEAGVSQNFKADDTILKVNGKTLYSITGIEVFGELKNAGDEVVVTVLRDGNIKDITVHRANYSFVDEEGKTVTANGFGISMPNNFLAYGRVKFSFFDAIGRAFMMSFKIVEVIFVTFAQLFTGALGIKGNLGGPVMTISLVSMASKFGFDFLLRTLSVFSVSLAVMNVLPLPALDGSKVVFTLIEWVRGKPINRKVENTIHVVGLFVLFAMTIIFDIINFI